MATVTVWAATPADVERISLRLRTEDRREIDNAGTDPLPYLLAGLRASKRCLVVNIDSEPACVCGAIEEEPGVGLAWITSTPRVQCRAFARSCRNILDQLANGFELLHAVASVNNDHHLRWASWLGFRKFAVPSLIDGRAYHHFYYINRKCQSPHR